MTFQEEETKAVRGGLESNILDGAAMVLVSPIVVPALLLGLRPMAKTFLKGGLFLTATLKQLARGTSAGWSNIVAEARSEARTVVLPEPEEATAEQPQQFEEGDLQHITGVGRKFAELLQASGVESLRALARRNPAHLHEKLMQVNVQRQIVSHAPSLEQVTEWVAQAKSIVV
jgi:predicted flap endonuclease-1-like 5' DNA nuclease